MEKKQPDLTELEAALVDAMKEARLRPRAHRTGLQPGNGTNYDLEFGFNSKTNKLCCIWWKEQGAGGQAFNCTVGEYVAPQYMMEKMGTRWADTHAIGAAFNLISQRLVDMQVAHKSLLYLPAYHFRDIVESSFLLVETEQRAAGRPPIPNWVSMGAE